jgi:putative effector of murein hydrolase
MARPVWFQRRLIALNWHMFCGITSLFLRWPRWLLPHVLGAKLARALAVKSVTAPVALEIAQQTGLPPDLVVVGVMISGLFGMVFGPAVLAVGSSKGDIPEIGAAPGCASHGPGTERAYEPGQTCRRLRLCQYGVIRVRLRAVASGAP